MGHIGGLLGLIGLRWFQSDQHSLLTIYGPPGTDLFVAGILQSLKPSVEIGLGVGAGGRTPEKLTKVIIIKDGGDISVNGVRVRAARNSHLDDAPNHPAADGSQLLSYRFDYKNYGIGYTGDTGQSDAVIQLEKGVNLLVSGVIDRQAAIAMANGASISSEEKQALIKHFKTQHLSPQEAGSIAA
jgi:ribonuclease BN (tRNA processing enzyme)